VLFYWYYSGSVRSGRSHLWVAVGQEVSANDPAKAMTRLGALAADHPGSMPALVARLQRARLLEQAALERLYSSDRSVKELVEARDTYAQLTRECAPYPVLEQEALLGLAKAEESLVGVRNPEGDKELLGSLDRALEYYHRYLETAPQDNALVKATREHVADLEEHRKDVVAWYTDQNELAANAAKTRLSGTPVK